MKFVSLFAAVALAQEEETEAAPALARGEACVENPTGCDVGLCCAEGIFKEDVIDGEVSDSFYDNLITICSGDGESEYANDEGEEYWMTCITIDGATKVAASVAAMAVAATMMA